MAWAWVLHSIIERNKNQIIIARNIFQNEHRRIAFVESLRVPKTNTHWQNYLKISQSVNCCDTRWYGWQNLDAKLDIWIMFALHSRTCTFHTNCCLFFIVPLCSATIKRVQIWCIFPCKRRGALITHKCILLFKTFRHESWCRAILFSLCLLRCVRNATANHIHTIEIMKF